MKTNVYEILKVGSLTSQQTDRKEQFLEITVFLFLILPSMALSFFASDQGSLSFSLSAVATILRDLALVSLISFFLWRNRESVLSLGWNVKNFWKEFVLGVILFSLLLHLGQTGKRSSRGWIVASIDAHFPRSPRIRRDPVSHHPGCARCHFRRNHLPRLFDASFPVNDERTAGSTSFYNSLRLGSWL